MNSQNQVLEKDLNFAITPKRISMLDMVASAEKGMKNVKNQAKVDLARNKITQNFK